MSSLLLDASVILAAFDSDHGLHGPSRALLTDPEAGGILVSCDTRDLIGKGLARSPALARD